MVHVTAKQFKVAFLEAYKQKPFSLELFFGDETYSMSEYLARSHHMIWDRPSVIRNTARLLGVQMVEGEPLRLDAVFVHSDKVSDEIKQRNWFPPLIILEHENLIDGIESEIQSLFSVRSRLKVCITYFKEIEKEARMKMVRERISRCYALITAMISEDEETEYLFLLGQRNLQGALSWFSMSFNARQGLQDAEFSPE